MKTKTTLNLKHLLVALIASGVLFISNGYAQNPHLQNVGLSTDASGVTATGYFLTDLSIYPRPTHGVVNIRANVSGQSTISITVIDMLGRVILERTKQLPVGIFEHQIDLSNLPNGMYLLELRSGDQTITTKLIKN